MVRSTLLAVGGVVFLLQTPALHAAGDGVRNGMIVAAESLAAAAGLEVLKQGGNAIDAAVAVGFALAVTYPEAGNIGGGGFMLIRLADGTATFIDFREQAPGQSTRTMYLDSAGAVIPGASELGPLSAGVPGSVAGLLFALERYGTMDRSQVMERAIQLATHGIVVDTRLASSLERFTPEFVRFASSRNVFTKDGTPYRVGDTLRQPDLARTLTGIMHHGAGGFYEGEIALRIVEEMDRSGGIITLDDLAAYKAVERIPLAGSYRGFDILTAPPPSAGGIALLNILNMLERFDPQQSPHLTARSVHLFSAAAQRAYADRAFYPGDPDFVAVPINTLISKEYARERIDGLDMVCATPSDRVAHGIIPVDDHQTTHYSVADKYGNVVSTTVTLNGFYGSKAVVGGAGFFLNNQMDDFVVKPGVPNQFGLIGGEANSIAPRKRMLSSMTPTIVVRDDAPYLIVGGRGGGRIPTAVAQVLLNMIDHGMHVKEAVAAPRVHHQWLPDELLYETAGLTMVTRDSLAAMGYVVKPTADPNGRCHALFLDAMTGMMYGGADPRESGVALGF